MLGNGKSVRLHPLFCILIIVTIAFTLLLCMRKLFRLILLHRLRPSLLKNTIPINSQRT